MSLHITLGPMYASKTTSLIQKYNALNINHKIIVLDYDTERQDKFYEGYLANHNGVEIPCIKCSKLFDVLDIYKKRGNFQMSHEFDHLNDFGLSIEMHESRNALLNAEFILINEAQFYPDLVEFVKRFIHKNIYIYGLDGDFKQERIGNILDIIPLCDSVVKLKANCLCGQAAIFSKIITPDILEQYQPNAQYNPVCRKCL